MRRAALSSCASVIAINTLRTMFVFSEQSPILRANQKQLNSDLNVWIEDWEVRRLKINIKNDAPTSLSIEKALELYNFNDFTNPPDQMEIPVHTSYSTMKPYGRKLQLELSNVALKKGFTSKMWMPVGAARKSGTDIKAGARSTIVLTGGLVKVYHVSQLENPDQLARWPISGGSRRPYGQSSEQFRHLSQAVALNAYKSGLFFTKKQAEILKLTPAAGQVPCTVSIPADTRNAVMYFNVDQLECPEAALQLLNRSEPDVPSFLMSGEPVKNTTVLPTTFKSKYWLSERDAQLYAFNIKAGEERRGTILSQRMNTMEMFNAEQMTDVEQAFKVAGHYVQ